MILPDVNVLGCEWITLDRDYARFPGLKWCAPAAPAR